LLADDIVCGVEDETITTKTTIITSKDEDLGRADGISKRIPSWSKL